MPTNEELQSQINDLNVRLSELKDIYWKTHNIDKDVFPNPVYFQQMVVLPSTDGAPTVVPRTGNMSLIYDKTNDDLYVYNGGWVKVTLS